MLTADLLKRLREALRHCLEIASICILASLAVLVIVGVVSRKAGYSLAWYDEVASILLAWLTYYGTALAALHRAHLSLPGFVNRTHGGLRTVLIAFRGLTVASFFLLTAWMGVKLLGVLGGTTLVSLPWLPLRLVYSVIPLGAALFLLAELLNTIEEWLQTRLA